MNPAQAYTIMFFTGGFLYCALEILMRGYSHISMLLAGGICFVLVGAVQNLLGGQASLVGQMLLSYDHGGGICCRHDRESLSASGGMGLFRTAVQLSGADLSFIL